MVKLRRNHFQTVVDRVLLWRWVYFESLTTITHTKNEVSRQNHDNNATRWMAFGVDISWHREIDKDSPALHYYTKIKYYIMTKWHDSILS